MLFSFFGQFALSSSLSLLLLSPHFGACLLGCLRAESACDVLPMTISIPVDWPVRFGAVRCVRAVAYRRVGWVGVVGVIDDHSYVADPGMSGWVLDVDARTLGNRECTMEGRDV